MVARLHPVRTTTINVPLMAVGTRAVSPFRDEEPPISFANVANQMFLHDPAHPLKEPNELLAELGGKLTDPNAVNWNCPFCHQTLTWMLFASHVRPCLKRNFSTLPSGLRVYTGASLTVTNEGVIADA